jgi:hypothetical protein
MKLYGALAIHVHAEDILRTPRFWDKLKRAFGGKPDLRTGRQRAALEATAIVEAARDALRRFGANNAISLVIDNTVLFHGFDELRLAVEHHEAGIHHVMELQARSEHPKGVPAMRVVISGRVEALTPKSGEDADAYRKRVEPLVNDAKALELYRVQFTGFVDRVRDALATAMPTARIEVEAAEPRVVRPDANATEPQAESPSSRGYDPYLYYYPSPMFYVADMLMWSALFSMAMPPHFVVVDHHNHVQGYADDPGIQSGPTTSAASDDGNYWSGDNEAGSGADTGGGDTGGDGGGSWWDGDAGGDAGGDFGGDAGGDFGGFDGGGFDL